MGLISVLMSNVTPADVNRCKKCDKWRVALCNLVFMRCFHMILRLMLKIPIQTLIETGCMVGDWQVLGERQIPDGKLRWG